MKVVFYTAPSGRSPVWDYLKTLELRDRARLLEALSDVERHGLNAVKVRFRHIERKLWEMKIDAYRVFYVVLQGDELVALHAYRKQGQKLPRNEKEIALRRMQEVLYEA